MQVILLEEHRRLGKVGDVVSVKNGFARNFLIPHKMAIQATAANLRALEQQREAWLKEFEEKKSKAHSVKAAIDGSSLHIIKQAGIDNKLYGSVTQKDIWNAIKEKTGETLSKNAVSIAEPIKYLGSYNLDVNIFADVTASVTVFVARTEAEAALYEAKQKKETAASHAQDAELTQATEENTEAVQTTVSEQRDNKRKVTKSKSKRPKKQTTDSP